MELYIVTEFGCNSTPSEMWVPKVTVFTDKIAAYAHYHRVAPRLDDPDNLATRTTLDDNSAECIIELPGYYAGMSDRAKRPRGAKIECVRLSI